MLVTIISEDEFGKSVAYLLKREFAVKEISLKQGLEHDWHNGDHGLIAVCTDRPYFAAFEELSDRLVKANLPLTFACITDSVVLMGPLIIPGKSPCYRCFRKRLLCNIGSALPIAQERVVQSAFNRDWTLKSPGMLPTTPVLAAARVARHAALNQRDYGLVTQVSLVRSQSVIFRIQRVHGCGCLFSSQDANQQSHPPDLKSVVERLLS